MDFREVTENEDIKEEVSTVEEVVEDNKETVTTANLGSKWIDLDNMQFSVNGKVYTLGKTTLQEMIDDGVPFDENDINNAGNNVNPNYTSDSFEIVLGVIPLAVL